MRANVPDAGLAPRGRSTSAAAGERLGAHRAGSGPGVFAAEDRRAAVMGGGRVSSLPPLLIEGAKSSNSWINDRDAAYS